MSRLASSDTEIRPALSRSSLGSTLLLVAALSAPLVSTLACAPSQSGETSNPGQPQAETELAASAADFADTIDPGVQTPLSAELPAWLEELAGLRGGVTATARADMARDAVAAFTPEQTMILLAQPGAVLGLTRTIALLEAAQAGPNSPVEAASTEELAALAALYGALDQPIFNLDQSWASQDRSVFAPLMPTILEALGPAGLDAHRAEVEVLGATLFERLARTRALQCHLVAELLRRDPTHPAVAEAVVGLANTLSRTDPRLALRAVELARALHPAPGPSYDLEVAGRAYFVLELDRGDAAIEAARATLKADDRSLDERLAALETAREVVTRAIETRGKPGYDPRLAHARAMFALHNFGAAERLFQTLHDEQPNDARARAGLAQSLMIHKLDLDRAQSLVRDSSGLENRDAAYYEIAVGLRFLRIFQSLLPQIMAAPSTAQAMLAEPLSLARADIEAYEALGDDRAVVLHAMLDGVERALPSLVDGDPTRQRALLIEILEMAPLVQAKVPDEPLAYGLLMSAAELHPDRAWAVAATAVPPPTHGPPSLHLRRTRAVLNLAVIWEDPALLDTVSALIDTLPAGLPELEVLRTAADMFAIHARLSGSVDSRERAIGIYLGLSEQAGGPVALNNLGVLLWEQGDRDQARRAFEAARDLAGQTAAIVHLNLLALDTSAAATAELERFALEAGGNASQRRHAMRWLAARTRGAERAQWQDRRAASLREPSALPRPSDLPNKTGTLLEGQLSFDIGYSAEGLGVVADASSTPWLVLVPDQGD